MKKHIRRIISVIITSLLLCGCISQVEESSTFAMEIEGSDTYNDFYYVVNGDEVAITDYYGNDENVSIPEMIEGKTVTSIKDNTFMNCIGIKTVNIPSSIKNIDKDIFSGCYNLSNINVDNNNNNYSSVNGILFDDVNKTIIRYPQGRSGDEYEVPNGTKKIGYSAFEDCKNLSSIIIPNSVVSIDDLAFAHCTNLTWNRIPDSVTSIGKFAFYNCCNLEAINIPAQVKT